MDRPLPTTPGYLRPLGLPVGSVRALLLLGLAARALLDLRAGAGVADWLAAALIVSAAAYFGARSGGVGGQAGGRPLGLPTGSVRILFLAACAYGLWLYLRDHTVAWEQVPVAWVFAAFLVGVLMRAVLRRARVQDDDAGTSRIYHLQALLTLGAAAGLVVLGARPDLVSPGWVPPMLAAACTYYAGAR
jgi:hypothetical protein